MSNTPSRAEIEALGSQHLREQDRKMVTRFADAVESEVQKQDEALIRQLVDALKVAVLQNNCNMVMTGEELRQSRSAIKVARARLEGKS